MRAVFGLLRKSFCELVAGVLIASGAVRRAKRRALLHPSVTAICFHNPSPALFRRCVEWLLENGYALISGQELCEILSGMKPFPRGAAWISFDDGWRDILQAVLPFALERKLPVTLFIPTGIVDGPGLFPWLHDEQHPAFDARESRLKTAAGNLRESVTVAELKRVAAAPGVTVGAHTVTHPLTVRCSEEQLQREIGECKVALEAWTGNSVRCFAYPQGQFDGRELPWLRTFGYDIAATTENGFITPETDRYRLPRLTVADDISFPEAVCNMVGLWRPIVDPVKKAARHGVSAVLGLIAALWGLLAWVDRP